MSCAPSVSQSEGELQIARRTDIEPFRVNTIRNGQRDYYLFTFDNNPATPASQCWYFKDANRDADAYRSLSSAMRLVTKELDVQHLSRELQAQEQAANRMLEVTKALCTTAFATTSITGPTGAFIFLPCLAGAAHTTVFASKLSIPEGLIDGSRNPSSSISGADIINFVDLIRSLDGHTKSDPNANACWTAEKIFTPVRSTMQSQAAGAVSADQQCNVFRPKSASNGPLARKSGEFSDKILGWVGAHQSIRIYRAGDSQANSRMYGKVVGPSTEDGKAGWFDLQFLECVNSG